MPIYYAYTLYSTNSPIESIMILISFSSFTDVWKGLKSFMLTYIKDRLNIESFRYLNI